MTTLGDDLDRLSSNDLGVLARDAMSILAERETTRPSRSCSP